MCVRLAVAENVPNFVYELSTSPSILLSLDKHSVVSGVVGK